MPLSMAMLLNIYSVIDREQCASLNKITAPSWRFESVCIEESDTVLND